MTQHTARLKNAPAQKRARPCALALWAGVLWLGSNGPALAEPVDPGRLFFTPTQRTQLEAARARSPFPSGTGKAMTAGEAAAPLHYDGLVVRSDGKTTRWVDGKPHLDGAGVSGLKPGQVRADGKVYEPYEVLRPLPAHTGVPGEQESAP